MTDKFCFAVFSVVECIPMPFSRPVSGVGVSAAGSSSRVASGCNFNFEIAIFFLVLIEDAEIVVDFIEGSELFEVAILSFEFELFLAVSEVFTAAIVNSSDCVRTSAAVDGRISHEGIFEGGH